MKLGYIIISPENNIGGLKNTIRSITNNYEDAKIVCTVSSNIKKEQLSEYKSLCKTYKGKNTITSLINKGFEKTEEEWNVIITEGSRIIKNIEKKYFSWIKNYKDVVYPLIVNYDSKGFPVQIYDKFYDCTLNGICINKKFYKEVGNLSENPLEISRKFWALEAKEKKANFKSILGIKIC